MQFKRAGGTIFGVDFNKQEQAAIDKEIERQCMAKLGELLRDAEDDIDREVLYFLMTEHGHDHDMLEKDYFTFAKLLNDLISHYELEEKDCGYLCDRALKAVGIDVLELKKRTE